LEAILNKVDNTIYSIYTDYESNHTKAYTAILGCRAETLNGIPNGMISESFNGGNYVKLSAKGGF
jgi:predicted transcriptional regulator YdeE